MRAASSGLGATSEVAAVESLEPSPQAVSNIADPANMAIDTAVTVVRVPLMAPPGHRTTHRSYRRRAHVSVSADWTPRVAVWFLPF